MLDFIEKIQKKPEHVRLRWALGLTFFSMLFIILIWFVSLSVKNQKNSNETSTSEEQKAILEEFNQQKKSLKDTASEMKNTYDKTLENIPAGN